MRSRLLVPVLALLGALLSAGCGVPVDAQARALDPSAAPYQVVTRQRSAPPTGTFRVVVYLVRDSALLPVPRRVPASPTPEQVLAALAAGPTSTEQADGVSTGLPVDGDISLSGVEGTTAVVSVPAEAGTSSRSDAVLAFGQVVLSLTALPAVTGVLFEQDGKPLQVPRSDGSLSTGPLVRLDYRDLIDPA